MADRPCEYCPAWEWLRDPATIEGEQAIRLEERMRTERLVARLVDQIHGLENEVRQLKVKLRNKAA